MINSVILFDLPGLNDMPAFERWYMRYHAPQVIARFQPWLTRYVSYRVVPAPEDAQAYGVYNYRLSQAWWRELPGPPTDALSFDQPKGMTGPPAVVLIDLPPQATEDFMGGEEAADSKNILRWVTIFKYPDGVSVEEGEDWYLKVHAPEVMNQPGLTRFFSYRAIPSSGPLPGWKSPRGGEDTAPPPTPWVRLSELWYENFDGWRRSVISSPPTYTTPPWAKHSTYPFLQPKTDFVSAFVLESPSDDFLKDLRGYI